MEVDGVTYPPAYTLQEGVYYSFLYHYTHHYVVMKERLNVLPV